MQKLAQGAKKCIELRGEYVEQIPSLVAVACFLPGRAKDLSVPPRITGKGKVLPRTDHEGPEKEQMYRSTLPSTSALDVGGWSTPHSGRFIPRKDPITLVQEAGWAPGPIWTGAEKLVPHRDSIPGPSNP